MPAPAAGGQRDRHRQSYLRHRSRTASCWLDQRGGAVTLNLS